MMETNLKTARKVSVAAATVIALACGTNYIYSAWGPQFAAKLQLSSTEQNLIGTFGNLGMYTTGIPVGLLVDARGARPGTLIGCVMLGVGYFGLYRAFVAGAGAMALPWFCLLSFMTGAGGAAAFTGAIKTSALNWPDSRGTATAFPLAAFGLSAFFFSSVSSAFFPNNTSDFLLMLSIGTFALIFGSSFFLRVIPHSPYGIVPSDDLHRIESNPLENTKAAESWRKTSPEPGMQEMASNDHPQLESTKNASLPEVSEDAQDTHEASSLLSYASNNEALGDDPLTDSTAHDSHGIDIRGLAMLQHLEFYHFFLLLGILTGIGLMTINNIGNDAQALWTHWDDSVTPELIQKRQLVHVSVLSMMSFCGRLLSGIGSDILVTRLHMSRFWCILFSSVIFLIAQLVGATVQDPNHLFFLSGLTGFAYGFLFGAALALLAETFGVHGLSQNWGCMTVAPIIFGNLFNLIYGQIYDQHSLVTPEGHHNCPDGRSCYRSAYWVTFGASLVSVVLSLWSIKWNQIKKKKLMSKETRREERIE